MAKLRQKDITVGNFNAGKAIGSDVSWLSLFESGTPSNVPGKEEDARGQPPSPIMRFLPEPGCIATPQAKDFCGLKCGACVPTREALPWIIPDVTSAAVAATA